MVGKTIAQLVKFPKSELSAGRNVDGAYFLRRFIDDVEKYVVNAPILAPSFP